MQIRPATGSTDKRFYNPDRDIAYLGAHLLAKAVEHISSDKRTAWQTEVMKKFDLTEDDLADAAVKFVAAFELIQKSPADYPDMSDALRASGFLDTPRAAQHLLEAKIGQFVCGAFLHGVKDITVYKEAAPISVSELVTAAERTVNACERSKLVTAICRYLWFARQLFGLRP
jgi:hypothetical protein